MKYLISVMFGRFYRSILVFQKVHLSKLKVYLIFDITDELLLIWKLKVSEFISSKILPRTFLFSFLNALTNHNIGEVEKVRFIDSFMERTTNPRIVPSRAVSSVGRALALHARGPEFESPTVHKT